MIYKFHIRSFAILSQYSFTAWRNINQVAVVFNSWPKLDWSLYRWTDDRLICDWLVFCSINYDSQTRLCESTYLQAKIYGLEPPLLIWQVFYLILDSQFSRIEVRWKANTRIAQRSLQSTHSHNYVHQVNLAQLVSSWLMKMKQSGLGQCNLPSFQAKNNSSVIDCAKLINHPSKAERTDIVSANVWWMSFGCIKATSNKNYLWTKFKRYRNDKTSKRRNVLGVPHRPVVPRNVPIVTFAWTRPNLGHVSCTREETSLVVSMQRDCHHCIARIKHFLRSIAVVYIKVNNEDSIQPEICLEIPRGNSNIVEETKAHRLLVLGMMSRRSDDCERVCQLSKRN